MINAAIFDMDGTFLDSMPYWMNAGENFLESLQIQAEENLGEKLLDMTLQDGCIYLKEKYSLNLSPEQIEEKIKKSVTKYFYTYSKAEAFFFQEKKEFLK